MKYKLNFDGACNPNPGEMGIGVVVYSEKNEKKMELSEKCGFGTNIKAEYLAIIRGFEELSKIYTGCLLVQGDLQLVIKQSRNEWKVKQDDIIPLYKKVKELEKRFESVEFKWIKREENKEADLLSAKSLGLDLTERDETRVQLTPGNSYEFVFNDDELITTVRDEKYNRDVLRYHVKKASRNGKRIRGTYFETGAKRLIESLKLRKPLHNKKIRIIPTQQQHWIDYILEELGD
ncbi:MAG: ribonuclease HI family protein [Thermoplasmata archaeon]|nr:ribonuclease HI family protein [Thermoplasmata archaeon]